jgi:hypothetical protein
MAGSVGEGQPADNGEAQRERLRDLFDSTLGVVSEAVAAAERRVGARGEAALWDTGESFADSLRAVQRSNDEIGERLGTDNPAAAAYRTVTDELRRLSDFFWAAHGDLDADARTEANRLIESVRAAQSRYVASTEAVFEPANSVRARVRDGVFISYSHRDSVWLEHLRTHLAPHVRDGITVWDDTRIAPGSKWREEIEAALSSARVAVLIVSPDFLASEFIHKEELPSILRAAEEEGLVILWIPVRTSAYFDTWIKDYQAAHDPGKPLAGLSRAARDKALVDIGLKIRRAAKHPATG